MFLRNGLLFLSIGIVGCGTNERSVITKEPASKVKSNDEKEAEAKQMAENSLEKRRHLFLNGDWSYLHGNEKRIIDFNHDYFYDYADVDGEQLFRRRGWFVLNNNKIILHVMKERGVKQEGPPTQIDFKIIKYDVPENGENVRFVKDVIAKGPKTIELELDGKKVIFNRPTKNE
jgi:hypothetical protein